MNPSVQQILSRGTVIPAHPLALNASRKLDERRQRALARYYIAAGVGGIAVGVHTTQFQIRDPRIGLYKPVLALAAEEMRNADASRAEPLIRVAGVVGPTPQAVAEASIATELGYHAALLSLSALQGASIDVLIDHCRAVGQVIPIVGFYLQPAAGGRPLPYAFWRRFAEIESVVAIKIAPFNRYQTIDVVRAVAEAGRDDIALYTGNDDNIVNDLLTPYRLKVGGTIIERRIVGGLLGHWACWTRRAVEMFAEIQSAVAAKQPLNLRWLTRNIEVTDCNSAFFDVAGNFHGVIAGIHEVLRHQGLLEGIWCLDEQETLSPGQAEEIDRVYNAYPDLNDDQFVAQHLSSWLQ